MSLIYRLHILWCVITYINQESCGIFGKLLACHLLRTTSQSNQSKIASSKGFLEHKLQFWLMISLLSGSKHRLELLNSPTGNNARHWLLAFARRGTGQEYAVERGGIP